MMEMGQSWGCRQLPGRWESHPLCWAGRQRDPVAQSGLDPPSIRLWSRRGGGCSWEPPKVGFPFYSPPQPVNLPLCCSARDLWEREQSWSGRYPSGSTQVGWERWSSLVCRLSHGGPALPAELAGLNIHSLVRSACHT